MTEKVKPTLRQMASTAFHKTKKYIDRGLDKLVETSTSKPGYEYLASLKDSKKD